MKETKIYIMESSEGEYSDSPSWIEKAFRRKEDAEAFARQLDAERFAEPAIEVKLWEEVENVWYCTNEEKYGMNWDAVPDDISHDKEKCEAYIKEQDERERAFVLEYLNAHGSRQYTMDDVLRQEVWQQNQCCDWNHCYVHEITLVE